MMPLPLIAGNWKMNGSQTHVIEWVETLFSHYSEIKNTVELAVFPPFVYLSQIKKLLTGTNVAWGAQNVSAEKKGAYTGEISAEMLKELNCRYVIVGHSERRLLFGETNTEIAAKGKLALETGLCPILCVGETETQREKNQTFSVIEEQLNVLFSWAEDREALKKCVVAYEPVWAIGTGIVATPEQAEEVHEALRNQVKKYDKELALGLRILYGGSVNPGNARALLAMPNVNGALVGGASLEAKSFLEIAKQCSN